MIHLSHPPYACSCPATCPLQFYLIWPSEDEFAGFKLKGGPTANRSPANVPGPLPRYGSAAGLHYMLLAVPAKQVRASVTPVGATQRRCVHCHDTIVPPWSRSFPMSLLLALPHCRAFLVVFTCHQPCLFLTICGCWTGLPLPSVVLCCRLLVCVAASLCLSSLLMCWMRTGRQQQWGRCWHSSNAFR